MKILYLTPGCFDKGGISRYNRYQIQAIRELYGIDNVKVLSLHGPHSDDFEEPFQVYWHGTGLNKKSIAKFILRGVRESIIWNPDLILAAHVNFSGIAKLMSKFRGNRTWLNTYGLEVWSGLKKLPHWGLKKTDVVISDCHYTARYLEDGNLRQKGSVKVIWDCVDLKRFCPAPASTAIAEHYNIPDPTSHQLIVSLGRISKIAAHKGYDRLIKAFRKVHQQHPMARLVFAGKGDLIDDLKRLAFEEGVADKVTFTGMVEEKHLPDIYRMAYIFSLASDRGKGRGEGIPLTPLEAMACEVPIIVGNYDGSQEAIHQNENGYVIDSLNIDEHAACLSELLADPQLRNRKAAEAVKIAHRYFSYDSFKEKHATIIGQVIKDK